jgi:hypothetical protein
LREADLPDLTGDKGLEPPLDEDTVEGFRGAGTAGVREAGRRLLDGIGVGSTTRTRRGGRMYKV